MLRKNEEKNKLNLEWKRVNETKIDITTTSMCAERWDYKSPVRILCCEAIISPKVAFRISVDNEIELKDYTIVAEPEDIRPVVGDSGPEWKRFPKRRLITIVETGKGSVIKLAEISKIR